MLTPSPLQTTSFFLVKVFFNTYLTVVLLRFIFQLVRADFYNPISQFIVRATNPCLIHLRKIVPGFMGLDISSLLLLLILQLVELIFFLLIKGSHLSLSPTFFLGLTLWGIGELLDLTITIYFYAILIFAILSWVPQTGYNPLLLLLVQVINPALRYIQRYIKPIGGLDLSPWFLIILLQVMVLLFVHPLVNYGIQLSLIR
jgi:YggT family protein